MRTWWTQLIQWSGRASGPRPLWTHTCDTTGQCGVTRGKPKAFCFCFSYGWVHAITSGMKHHGWNINRFLQHVCTREIRKVWFVPPSFQNGSAKLKRNQSASTSHHNLYTYIEHLDQMTTETIKLVVQKVLLFYSWLLILYSN